MAERSCRPAFSLPFHGLIVVRQVDFSNEVPDQFDFLPAMAAGFVRRMDDNFLYKLIDNGGRQFANAHIFPYNGCKAVKVGFMVLSNVWLNPLVSMTDEAGMRNRCETFNDLLQGVGINQFLDDEMIEGYISYCKSQHTA